MTRQRPWAVRRHDGANTALGQCRQHTGRRRLGPVAKAVGGGLSRAARGRESESCGGDLGRGLARDTPLVGPLDPGRVVARQDAPGRWDHRRGRRASSGRSPDEVGPPQNPRTLESPRERPTAGRGRAPPSLEPVPTQRCRPRPSGFGEVRCGARNRGPGHRSRLSSAVTAVRTKGSATWRTPEGRRSGARILGS